MPPVMGAGNGYQLWVLWHQQWVLADGASDDAEDVSEDRWLAMTFTAAAYTWPGRVCLMEKFSSAKVLP
jgi:hypothetical protein